LVFGVFLEVTEEVGLKGELSVWWSSSKLKPREMNIGMQTQEFCRYGVVK
jgi:hypothetical protein